jgi:hypothetical protein
MSMKTEQTSSGTYISQRAYMSLVQVRLEHLRGHDRYQLRDYIMFLSLAKGGKILESTHERSE